MFHINHAYSFVFEVFFGGGVSQNYPKSCPKKKNLFANLRNSNPWGCEEEVCKTFILSSLLLQCNITKKIFYMLSKRATPSKFNILYLNLSKMFVVRKRGQVIPFLMLTVC